MTKEGHKAAGKKKEALDNLHRINVAMWQLRRIQADQHTHGLKRRALTNCRMMRDILIAQINDLHTQTYKEEDPDESTDFCGRSADRNCSDGGEPV